MMSREELIDQLKFYRDMGISQVDVDSVCVAPPPLTDNPDEFIARAEAPGTMTLDQIREDLGDCQRCGLARSRTNIVFGSGNRDARLMFVGEAPGSDEDRQGLPFVGRAGQLLTKIIESIGLKREDVYICNVLKCRPPGNRNPEPIEVETCSPFLKSQIAAINPQIVCCLGTFAAQTVLGMKVPISKLRGQFHEIDGIRYIATFHPAYLLRNASKKREVWEDMKTIRAALVEPGS
jgi:uracil-DNA glycosylase family 4